MNSTWFYITIYLISVFMASVSQVLLKKAALKSYQSVLSEYLNVRVIVAYCIFFGTTLFCVWAYKGIPLSMGPILEMTAYLYITFFGVVIFKEKLNARKSLALALIMLGITIYAL